MINSDFRKKMTNSWFSYLQSQICKEFEFLENNKFKFVKREWKKEKKHEGGGTSYLLSGGKIFDQNFLGKVPDTVDLFTPTLSKILPPVIR